MRYFFGQDQSSHWYLIPDDRRLEWDTWTNLDEDSEAAWTAPDFAEELGHHPSWTTFENPRHEV